MLRLKSQIQFQISKKYHLGVLHGLGWLLCFKQFTKNPVSPSIKFHKKIQLFKTWNNHKKFQCPKTHVHIVLEWYVLLNWFLFYSFSFEIWWRWYVRPGHHLHRILFERKISLFILQKGRSVNCLEECDLFRYFLNIYTHMDRQSNTREPNKSHPI